MLSGTFMLRLVVHELVDDWDETGGNASALAFAEPDDQVHPSDWLLYSYGTSFF